jgi:hypothetical protein
VKQEFWRVTAGIPVLQGGDQSRVGEHTRPWLKVWDAVRITADVTARGQGVKAFGAGWYVVSASGSKIDTD